MVYGTWFRVHGLCFSGLVSVLIIGLAFIIQMTLLPLERFIERPVASPPLNLSNLSEGKSSNLTSVQKAGETIIRILALETDSRESGLPNLPAAYLLHQTRVICRPFIVDLQLTAEADGVWHHFVHKEISPSIYRLRNSFHCEVA